MCQWTEEDVQAILSFLSRRILQASISSFGCGWVMDCGGDCYLPSLLPTYFLTAVYIAWDKISTSAWFLLAKVQISHLKLLAAVFLPRISCPRWRKHWLLEAFPLMYHSVPDYSTPCFFIQQWILLASDFQKHCCVCFIALFLNVMRLTLVWNTFKAYLAY